MERLGSEVRVYIIGLSDIAVFFAIFEMDPIHYTVCCRSGIFSFRKFVNWLTLKCESLEKTKKQFYLYLYIYSCIHTHFTQPTYCRNYFQ